jgi:lysophospholipase L1-like esterase
VAGPPQPLVRLVWHHGLPREGRIEHALHRWGLLASNLDVPARFPDAAMLHDLLARLQAALAADAVPFAVFALEPGGRPDAGYWPRLSGHLTPEGNRAFARFLAAEVAAAVPSAQDAPEEASP